tara:strand:- start:11450 stop:11809 length:360 start_codon:yes stop_codon:yes gene_type:complete
MSSNCSFRITRTTEDLAQTITALSQRLVDLEQRVESIETQVNQSQGDLPFKEIEMLDGIDQQLKVCKELLEVTNDQDKTNQIEVLETNSEEMESEETDPQEIESEQMWIEEQKDESIAA